MLGQAYMTRYTCLYQKHLQYLKLLISAIQLCLSIMLVHYFYYKLKKFVISSILHIIFHILGLYKSLHTLYHPIHSHLLQPQSRPSWNFY